MRRGDFIKELIVGKNDSGQRLDRFVSKSVPLLPASLLQKYLRLKRIKLNGRGAPRNTRLHAGDAVQLYVSDEYFEVPRPENAYMRIAIPDIDILYEDENIILVDKKPGVIVHSDEGETVNTLISHIQAYLYKKGEWDPAVENSFAPALCNRIDRNTGGIVIAAKNAEALRIINEKIKKREIKKYYMCIVHGVMSPPSGRLEGFIFKDSVKNQVYVRPRRTPGAKAAATIYKTIAQKDGLSLVECELVTGRTHQIRAQLAAADHPLLGDGKYGSEAQNKKYRQKYQALYSYKIVFSFDSPAGILNYLKSRSFKVKSINFAEKYFEGLFK